jgi:hypothetical protein
MQHASARPMLTLVLSTLADCFTAMKSRFGDKLRRAAKLLDELQQDIFAEDWDLIASYPNAFRALVPVFTKYTDAAFPGDDVSSNQYLRSMIVVLLVCTASYKRNLCLVDLAHFSNEFDALFL